MGTSSGAKKAWLTRRKGTKTDLPGNKKQTKKRPKTFSKKDIVPYSKLTPAQRKKIDQKTRPKTTKKKPTTFKKISKKDKAKFDKMAKQSLTDVMRKRAAKIRKNPKLAATFKQAQNIMRQGRSGRGKRRKQMIPNKNAIQVRGVKAAKKKMIAKWNGQSTSGGAYKLPAGSAKRTEHALRLAKDRYKNSILYAGEPLHPEFVDIVDKDGNKLLKPLKAEPIVKMVDGKKKTVGYKPSGNYWKPKETTLFATLMAYDDFGQVPNYFQNHFVNSFVKLGKYGTKKTGELLEMLLQELDTMATKSDKVLVLPQGKVVGNTEVCDGYRCKTMPIQHKDPEDQLGKAVGIRELEAGTTQGAIKGWITRRGGRKPTERQVSRKTNQILQETKDQVRWLSEDIWDEMGFSSPKEMEDSYDGNPKEFFEKIFNALDLAKGLKKSNVLSSKKKWLTKGIYSKKADEMSEALMNLEEASKKIDLIKTGQAYVHKSGTWLFLGSSDELTRTTINSLENLKIPLKSVNLFEKGLMANNLAISGGYINGEITVYNYGKKSSGTLVHEVGHHIYEHMKPQDKTQWQKVVAKNRKEKTARLVSSYINKMATKKEYEVAENILREEVFCELRTAYHTSPSKFERLSRSPKTRELVKTFLNYQSIKGYESMQSIEDMDSMHVSFLYDKDGSPTQNTDKAVRASIYTDGKHEMIDMTQDKLDDIAEYLSEATSFYKRQADKKAKKDSKRNDSAIVKKAWKKRRQNKRKTNQKSYKPTGDPAKKTQMQKDKERKDKIISALQKKELPKKHAKFLNKYGLGKHSYARFSANVILNDWKTSTKNIEAWYNGLEYDHKIILDRLSGTKEQIKSIPEDAEKILKSYGKGLKWKDMDKKSRDQITNSIPEILRDISNQEVGIEISVPQINKGKLKKVAKTLGVPLATLLSNDRLMDLYPEIIASKTSTYLPYALSKIPAMASRETITNDQANFTWDYLAKPSEKLATLKDVGISDSSLIDLKWKKIPKGMRGKIMSIESFEQLIMKHKELPSYSKRYQALASLKKKFAKASGTSDGAVKAWRTRRGANPALDEAEDIYDKMINADGIEETRKNIVDLVRGSSIKVENQMAINRMVQDWDLIQHKIAKDKGCQIDNDGNYKTHVGWTINQNKMAGKDPNQMENVCSSSASVLKNYMTTNPALKQFGIKAETVKGEYIGKGKSHNVAAHQTGTGIQDINDDNKDASKIHRFLYDNGYKKAIFGIGHEWLKLGDGTIIDGAYGQFLPRKVKNIFERIAIIPPDDPRQKWYNTTGGVPYDKDLPEEEYQKDWHLLGLEAVN